MSVLNVGDRVRVTTASVSQLGRVIVAGSAGDVLDFYRGKPLIWFGRTVGTAFYPPSAVTVIQAANISWRTAGRA